MGSHLSKRDPAHPNHHCSLSGFSSLGETGEAQQGKSNCLPPLQQESLALLNTFSATEVLNQLAEITPFNTELLTSSALIKIYPQAVTELTVIQPESGTISQVGQAPGAHMWDITVIWPQTWWEAQAAPTIGDQHHSTALVSFGSGWIILCSLSKNSANVSLHQDPELAML